MTEKDVNENAEPASERPANSKEITITLRRPSGQGLVITLCLAVLALIVGLVISDSLRDATPAPSATPTPTATQTPEATSTPEPTVTSLPAPPQTETGKSFTMPPVTGKNAIQAADTILQLAPAAYLQFVDQRGVVVEAKASYTVVGTTPAAGEVTRTTDFIVVSVTNE